MMCYKACVRAKVSLFRAQEVNDKDEKIIHQNEATKLLKLAGRYIKTF
jgi:aminoglycoside phosphotransferase family enzyme